MSGAILIEYLRPGQNVHGHDLTVTLGPSNVTLGGFPCFDARVSCHGNALSAMHIPTHMVGETEEQLQRDRPVCRRVVPQAEAFVRAYMDV